MTSACMWTQERSPAMGVHPRSLGSLSADVAVYDGNSKLPLNGAVRSIRLALSPVEAACRPAEGFGWGASAPPSPTLSAKPSTRVNIHELEERMVEKLGHERKDNAWDLLQKYICCKLTMPELLNLLPSTMGPENVHLAAELLEAVHNNARCMQPPPRPPSFQPKILRPPKGLRRKLPTNPHTAAPSNLVNGPTPLHSNAPPLYENAEKITPFTRKHRSPGVRERQQYEAKRRKMASFEEEAAGVAEPEDGRVGRREAGVHKRSLSGVGASGQVAKRHRMEGLQPKALLVPEPGGRHAEGLRSDGREEVTDEEQEDGEAEESPLSRIPLRAPLGIPFCASSPGGSNRFTPTLIPFSIPAGDAVDEATGRPLLPDSATIVQRVKRVAAREHDLQGVHPTAVQAIMMGLRTYLKTVAGACVDVARGRRQVKKEKEEGSLGGAQQGGGGAGVAVGNGGGKGETGAAAGGVAGVRAWAGGVAGMGARGVAGVGAGAGGVAGMGAGGVAGVGAGGGSLARAGRSPICAQDLMLATELNPRLLGENQAVHMERISFLL